MNLSGRLFFMLMGLILSTTVAAKTLLVFGDSLSAAHGIPVEQGWVELLQKRLRANEKTNRWKVINASISGETTAGGLARLGQLLDKHQPELCLIELGANDGLRGQSIRLMRSNLQQMIEACQTNGDVLLIGMLLPPNYGPAYTKPFAQSYQMLAEKYQLPLIPFLLKDVTEDPDMMQDDRLHPNAKAQPIILETVWEQLEALLN